MRRIAGRRVLDLDIARRSAQPRQIRSERYMRYAGESPQPRQQLIIEALAGVGILIVLVRKVDARRCDLLSWNRLVSRQALQQTVHEDSGPGEQHQRKCELEDHQQARQLSAVKFARAACAVLQDL